MRDVLETLKKLPPKCAVIMDGISQFIHRGAPNAVPAFLNPTMVDQWNRDHGVSPQQVQAMVVGVLQGWDMDGADPDTHADDLGEVRGPFNYHYVGEITISLEVRAPTEVEALLIAQRTIDELADDLAARCDGVASVGTSDTLDLIETTDPYA